MDAVGAAYMRDVQPGEIVTVSKDGIKSDTRRTNSAPKTLCVFEFVYFARPIHYRWGIGQFGTPESRCVFGR